MNDSYPLAGLLAHVLVVVVSLSVVAYSAFNYRTFRRTMRKPRLAYWLALLVCLFCALANVIYLVQGLFIDEFVHFGDEPVDAPFTILNHLLGQLQRLV
jgi:hypothetical protein